MVALAMLATSSASAQTPDFGLRGAAGGAAADASPDRRTADLTAGSNPPSNPNSPNYGKPRAHGTPPRPFPPRASARPRLPTLEPYRTSPQARAEKRVRPVPPVFSSDVLPPPVPPPPTVAVIPTLPIKPPPRPDTDPFAPTGIGIGNLRLRPFVESGLGYDSNPNRVVSPQHGSAFWRGDAGLGVQSDWSRHSLAGSLRVGYSDFFTVPAANRPDGVGAVTGRIDVTRDTSIDLGAAFSLDTLRPGSPELIGLSTAASTNRPLVASYGGYVGGTQRFNRLELSLRGSVDRSQFGDATFTDGTKQYLSLNDFTTVGLRPRAQYELTPGLRPFVEATVDKRAYDNVTDVNGFRRSSRGVTARAGAAFELTRLVTGEASVGVVQRDYDDPRLAPLRGPAIDAALIWTATPLTTVRLRGTTSVTETTIANVSGAITSTVTGEISHALMRNVTLTGTASYQTNDYKGVDLLTSPTGSITERYVTAGVKAEYNLTRTVVIKGSYSFERLRSTVTGSDYTANVFLLGLRLQR